MTNLIRAEWYRFWKYPLFKHMGIAVCFFPAAVSAFFEAIIPNQPIYGYDAIISLCGCYTFFLCLFVMPVIIHTICIAFQNKTIRNEQVAGHNAHRMLLSRLIVGAGIITSVSLICIFFIVGAITWKNGWNPSEPYFTENTDKVLNYFFGCIILAFVIIQAAAICILFTCITKNSASALLLSWFTYLAGEGISFLAALKTMYNAPELLRKIYMILPGMQLAIVGDAFRASSDIVYLAEYLPYILLSGILETAILYLIAHNTISAAD